MYDLKSRGRLSSHLQVGAVALALQSHGLDVRALRSPTVPEGKERLRIILHAHNTEQEVDALAHHLHKLLATTRDSASFAAAADSISTDIGDVLKTNTIPTAAATTKIKDRVPGLSIVLHPSRL